MIEYDSYLGCYVLIDGDEVICLGAETYSEAVEEAELIMAEGC